MKLQINTNGSWRDGIEFDADALWQLCADRRFDVRQNDTKEV